MLNYSFSEMIKKGTHIGHYIWDSDNKLTYYILGERNSLQIINLHYTLYILRRVFYILTNIIIVNQKMLSVNNNEYNRPWNRFDNEKYSKYFLYVNKKWKGGLLTNHKSIRKYNFKLLTNSYISLLNMHLIPSLIFVSNQPETGSSLFESISLNVPTSNLINSNKSFYGVHYGLPGNNESILVKNFFNVLFLKCTLESVKTKVMSLYKNKINHYMLKNKKIIKKNKKNYEITWKTKKRSPVLKKKKKVDYKNNKRHRWFNNYLKNNRQLKKIEKKEKIEKNLFMEALYKSPTLLANKKKLWDYIHKKKKKQEKQKEMKEMKEIKERKQENKKQEKQKEIKERNKENKKQEKQKEIKERNKEKKKQEKQKEIKERNKENKKNK